jgi:hypothetical protein
MKKLMAVFIVAALLAPLAVSPAQARGSRHSHHRRVVRVWHGPRYAYGPAWRYYPYPYYHSAYYPPVYYAPRAYVAPAPVYMPAPAPVVSFGFSFGGGHHR